MKTLHARIASFNKPLLPDLVNLKYDLMRKSFYRFFRATNHLYGESLSREKLPFSPAVWTCGDLHLENFGSYKGDNRLVYFDLNDFDEAMLAPASWELTRFISSIFVAFESLGIERKRAVNMAHSYLKTYSQTLANGKSFYIEPQTAKGIVGDFLTSVSKRKQKKLLGKHTVKKGNKRVLSMNKKFMEVTASEKKELCEHMNEWILSNSGRPYNYEVMDVVFRVAGLGSLGLKRYLFLLKSTNIREKYILLDAKQARSSSLAPYLKVPQPGWKNEAERVIAVQQRMQNILPFLLSTTVFKGDSFIVQELQPTEDSINLKQIKNRYRDIYQVITDMALLTASAQLRSSGRQNSAGADELIQFGQNDSWHQDLINSAIKLAQISRRQYMEFKTQNNK